MRVAIVACRPLPESTRTARPGARSSSLAAVGFALGLMLLTAGCSDDATKSAAPSASDPAADSATGSSATAGGDGKPAIGVPALADDLPNALVLGLSAFDARKPG
ncbi:hypothetical protein K2X89_04630, partial [Myxococcota bacterium]|nr:hypothetical protein [Myxococcota bacterium]